MAHITPVQSQQIKSFAGDVEGVVYCINRFVAKDIGGKFLRGANIRLDVLAMVKDELGNVFALMTNGQRKQFLANEWN